MDEKRADLSTELSDEESLTAGRAADGAAVGERRNAARVMGSDSGPITAQMFTLTEEFTDGDSSPLPQLGEKIGSTDGWKARPALTALSA